VDLPTKIIIVSSVTCWGLTPLLVVGHELGHALAVLRTGRRALVIVGHQPPLLKLQVGRLELRLHPQLAIPEFHPLTDMSKARGPYLGACRYDPRGLTAGQLRSIMRGGPLADIVTGLVFAGLGFVVADTSSILFMLAASGFVVSFLQGLMNLRPIREDKRISDGAHMLSLKGLSDDAVPIPLPEPTASPAGSSFPPPGC